MNISTRVFFAKDHLACAQISRAATRIPHGRTSLLPHFYVDYFVVGNTLAPLSQCRIKQETTKVAERVNQYPLGYPSRKALRHKSTNRAQFRTLFVWPKEITCGRCCTKNGTHRTMKISLIKL